MPDSVTAFAPGRVNLIGEHTDYNGGLALAFAIADGITVRAQRTTAGRVEVIAADLDATDSFELAAPAAADGWRAFARGAVAELQSAGFGLESCRLEISGTVARGSGLSSSAALEVALCLALLGLAGGAEPERLELARICSRIENRWVGTQSGLLDQIASLFGEQGGAVEIDFRSLAVTPVALHLRDHLLVTVDSSERHSNAAADGYNVRRAECARACELLGIASLRGATLEMAAQLPAPLAGRARHVITENLRVGETGAALRSGDLGRVGELLNESHDSLRDCYEVSTPAVEATVERLRDAGAIGARIVGGGFGGHVLGLLAPGTIPVKDAVVVAPGAGARLL